VGNTAAKTGQWQIPRDAPLPTRRSDARDEDEDDAPYSREGMEAHNKPPTIADLSPTEREGERLYQQACAYCHAADGTAENWIGEFLRPHPTDFTNPAQTAHLTDAWLDRVIRDGMPQTSMPSFGAMFDAAQRAAIIAYLKRAFLERQAPANK
jgi:cytochrome c oxidase cbb3-type subunit 3